MKKEEKIENSTMGNGKRNFSEWKGGKLKTNRGSIDNNPNLR